MSARACIAIAVAQLAGCAPEAAAPVVRLVDAGVDWDAMCASPCTCNPLTQTGCNADERCTWILAGSCGPHIGCATAGAVVRGGACSHGARGADNCTKGDVCVAGTCRAICDHQGGEPRCGSGETCTEVDAFGFDTQHAAGACLP